jgi:DNA-binding MarR family transcriptional regulator
MGETDLDSQVAAIRAFNRFYTGKIGVVDGVASSPFSLAEARVLYELAHREQLTATDIRKELGLDAGYMSRILRDFERRKLVTRQQSKTDERQRFLSLTAKGRRAFAPLDERSNRDVAAMLEEHSLYKQAGFHLVGEEQHHSFGNDLTAETWELNLRTTAQTSPAQPILKEC